LLHERWNASTGACSPPYHVRRAGRRTLAATLVSSQAAAQTAASIAVEGNRRVEVETIRSYFRPGPGGRLGQAQIDDGLKALIETGLFQDVQINQQGGRLVVTVVENPVIGRIALRATRRSRTNSFRPKSSPSRAAPVASDGAV